jgi:2-oxoacid:acceptor oxidoreductase gamma subunit (pyruvate/2-ketoisovalerate family)
MIEVRFQGVGGQGAVTASELLAVAAGNENKYSQAFPFFGVERRGAPVQSFCRIDDKQIRVHMRVYTPDVVVVLEKGLVEKVDVCAGMSGKKIAIVNSMAPMKKGFESANHVYYVDATNIAIKHLGAPIVNTAMLGAVAKVTGLVKLESLHKAIEERFPKELALKNIAAIDECYNSVRE